MFRSCRRGSALGAVGAALIVVALSLLPVSSAAARPRPARNAGRAPSLGRLPASRSDGEGSNSTRTATKVAGRTGAGNAGVTGQPPEKAPRRRTAAARTATGRDTPSPLPPTTEPEPELGAAPEPHVPAEPPHDGPPPPVPHDREPPPTADPAPPARPKGSDTGPRGGPDHAAEADAAAPEPAQVVTAPDPGQTSPSPSPPGPQPNEEPVWRDDLTPALAGLTAAAPAPTEVGAIVAAFASGGPGRDDHPTRLVPMAVAGTAPPADPTLTALTITLSTAFGSEGDRGIGAAFGAGHAHLGSPSGSTPTMAPVLAGSWRNG